MDEKRYLLKCGNYFGRCAPKTKFINFKTLGEIIVQALCKHVYCFLEKNEFYTYNSDSDFIYIIYTNKESMERRPLFLLQLFAIKQQPPSKSTLLELKFFVK